jgi:hypothetical protein
MIVPWKKMVSRKVAKAQRKEVGESRYLKLGSSAFASNE